MTVEMPYDDFIAEIQRQEDERKSALYKNAPGLINAFQPYTNDREHLTKLMNRFPGKSDAWYVANIMKISRGSASPTRTLVIVSDMKRGNNEVVEPNG